MINLRGHTCKLETQSTITRSFQHSRHLSCKYGHSFGGEGGGVGDLHTVNWDRTNVGGRGRSKVILILVRVICLLGRTFFSLVKILTRDLIAAESSV